MSWQTHGVPEVHRWGVTTTGGAYEFANLTSFLRAACHAGTVRLYFTKAAFDADSLGGALPGTGEGVIELTSGTNIDYYEGPDHVKTVWMRGIGGTATVTVIGTSRRF